MQQNGGKDADARQMNPFVGVSVLVGCHIGGDGNPINQTVHGHPQSQAQPPHGALRLGTFVIVIVVVMMVVPTIFAGLKSMIIRGVLMHMKKSHQQQHAQHSEQRGEHNGIQMLRCRGNGMRQHVQDRDAKNQATHQAHDQLHAEVRHAHSLRKHTTYQRGDEDQNTIDDKRGNHAWENSPFARVDRIGFAIVGMKTREKPPAANSSPPAPNTIADTAEAATETPWGSHRSISSPYSVNRTDAIRMVRLLDAYFQA
jgi:hypothetical protein